MLALLLMMMVVKILKVMLIFFGVGKGTWSGVLKGAGN